jgi:hypothetical protein
MKTYELTVMFPGKGVEEIKTVGIRVADVCLKQNFLPAIEDEGSLLQRLTQLEIGNALSPAETLFFWLPNHAKTPDLFFRGNVYARLSVKEDHGYEELSKIYCQGMITVTQAKVSVFLSPNHMQGRSISHPRALHESTSDLIANTAEDLGMKLMQSQVKMQLPDGWNSLPEGAVHEEGKTFDGQESMNKALLEHLRKGDILDCMAYLMFMHELGYAIDSTIY